MSKTWAQGEWHEVSWLTRATAEAFDWVALWALAAGLWLRTRRWHKPPERFVCSSDSFIEAILYTDGLRRLKT